MRIEEESKDVTEKNDTVIKKDEKMKKKMKCQTVNIVNKGYLESIQTMAILETLLLQ